MKEIAMTELETDDNVSLSQDEATKLIATCPPDGALNLRDRALIVVGLETGMQRMSLIGMTLDTVKMCRDGYPIASVPIKNHDEPFEVPLSDTAMIAIEPWRQWLRSQHITKGPLFRGLARHINNRGQRVYVTTNDEPLSMSALYAIVKRRGEQANIAKISPNIFRNTFLAWRLAAGIMPYQLAAITGQRVDVGMGPLQHVDLVRVGLEVRQATPTWLKTLINKRG